MAVYFVPGDPGRHAATGDPGRLARFELLVVLGLGLVAFAASGLWIAVRARRGSGA